jgi:hypothetical protein
VGCGLKTMTRLTPTQAEIEMEDAVLKYLRLSDPKTNTLLRTTNDKTTGSTRDVD